MSQTKYSPAPETQPYILPPGSLDNGSPNSKKLFHNSEIPVAPGYDSNFRRSSMNCTGRPSSYEQSLNNIDGTGGSEAAPFLPSSPNCSNPSAQSNAVSCDGLQYPKSNSLDLDERAEECRHFSNVCHSFSNYMYEGEKEILRIETHLQNLSARHKTMLVEDIDTYVSQIRSAVITNQNFINLLLGEQELDNSYTSGDVYKRLYGSRKQDEPGIELFAEPVCGDRHNHSEDPNTLLTNGPGHCADGYKPPGNINECNIGNTDSKSNAFESVDSPAHEGPPELVRDSSLDSLEDDRVQYDSLNIAPCKPYSHADLNAISRDVSKVRSTLRQFVRDWSAEGADERNAAYGPLLDSLDEYLPINDGEKVPRVLCPGSGLGRLPFEVAKRGYVSQGNEFSYFMLLGSNFALNYNLKPFCFPIQPYCLSTSNRRGYKDNLRTIWIPDTCPVDFISADRDFSMCAGEFVEVYGDQEGMWDGVLTCFFLDTAKNVLLYIETIARIIRPGGLWSNFGPLLYHYSEMPNEMSIELSWEEIKTVVERYFDIRNLDWRESYYTTNELSMMQVLYHCVFFVAIRNCVTVEADSSPDQ